MDEDYKFVNFEKYCARCVYRRKHDYESPCNECLEVGARIGTEVPEEFKEKT